MAIRIVDGVLGAGKTYFIVNWIAENLCIQLKDGSHILDPAKKVRLITNINSLRIPHEDFRVLVEKAGGFDKFFDKDYQEKFSGDWSIIYVLDEAQEWLRPLEKECKLSHKTKLYFEWCRHEGHDLWLITQHKSKIEKDVAELSENVISAQPRTNAIGNELTYISYTYEGVELEVHRLFFSKEIAALYQSSKKCEFIKIKNPRIRRFLLAMTVSLVFLALGGRWAWRRPCPPPVAIAPSSLLPGAAGFVPYVAGLDKLLVSYWLDGEGFDEFRQTLRDFKEEFNDGKLCGPDVAERAFDLGWEGVSFNMSRFGAKTYPYKLQCGDIVLKFSNHRSTASHPNCCLEIHSMSCWNPGWQAVLDRFLELLNHIGAAVRKETITESHITADLLDVDFAKTGLISHRRWLTKAPKKISETYEFYRPNYISFGKGDFMARFYDKTAELKHDEVKRDFFHKLWFDRAGYVPEHVARIEFQARRPVLKELQINTVEDLKSNLDAVWRYCVGSDDEGGWCRFCSRKLTDKDRKNKHQSRYATAFLWEFVRSVSFSQPEPPAKLERVKPPPQINMDLLGKSGAGSILSMCAALRMDPDDCNGHIAEACSIVKEQILNKYKKNRAEYIRRFETKRNHAHNSLFQ